MLSILANCRKYVDSVCSLKNLHFDRKIFRSRVRRALTAASRYHPQFALKQRIAGENDKIIFKAFSWKTCIHCCVSLGYMILWSTLALISTSIKPEDFYTAETSFAVNFSLTLMGFSNVFGLLIPLLISDGLPSLNASFITSRNLRFPPKCYRIISGLKY